MAKMRSTLTALALGVAVAGCAPPPPYTAYPMQQQSGRHDRLLLDAGFNVRPADSPRRAAQLQRLPPHRMLVRYRNERPVYLYADPDACRCVYFGNERAYQNYRRMVSEQNLVGDQYMAGRYDEPGSDWDAWGSDW